MMLPEEVIAIPLYMIINWRPPLIDAFALQHIPGMIMAGRFHLVLTYVSDTERAGGGGAD